MNLATDLRRVCLWIFKGSDDLADKTLEKNIKMYQNLNLRIGKVMIDDWLKMIIKRVGGREKSAERALTASVILSF